MNIMKAYMFLFMTLLIVSSCSSSRNSIATTQEDKALLSVVKKFDRKSTNIDLKESVSALYNEAAKIHLDKIDVYGTLQDASRWDKLLGEYNALQHLTDIINQSSSAKKLINPPSFIPRIEALKIDAGEDFYAMGQDYMTDSQKISYQAAYHAFEKALQYSPGYKDAAQQKERAYQRGLITVIVNPVSDNSFYYNNIGYNRYGNSFNNDYMQRNLVNDLGGSYSRSGPARFYSNWDARRSEIVPDMVVDLTWVNLDIPQPFTSNYSRNVNKQIQIGTDTSGHALYQTVTGTLYIAKHYFTASGDLETRITDVNSQELLGLRRFNSQFNWEQETATYRGDRRALSGYELSIISNSRWQVPSKDQILDELYQRMYPQVKNEIYNTVRW